MPDAMRDSIVAEGNYDTTNLSLKGLINVGPFFHLDISGSQIFYWQRPVFMSILPNTWCRHKIVQQI